MHDPLVKLEQHGKYDNHTSLSSLSPNVIVVIDDHVDLEECGATKIVGSCKNPSVVL